jgi:hypothetical protein
MQVRDAIAHLNPHEVREDANLPFTIQLYADSPEAYRAMETYFAAREDCSAARQDEAAAVVRRGEQQESGTVIRIYDESMSHHESDFVFRQSRPEEAVEAIIERHPELSLALARKICPFRQPVANGIILQISKENALFSVATAIPSVVPLLSLPWAVGEFASDTAFLTANQIRMAFMLAAASDRTVGYKQQRAEIASLFAGAFGWRALARELAGKIPMGGGLIPKAAIAFAGTYVVGASLERYYRIGYGYTKEERKAVYSEMLERGKHVADAMVRAYKGER